MKLLDENRLMDRNRVAELLGISVNGLRKLDREGRGPRRIKVGRLVRYRSRDLDAWLEQRAVGGEVKPSPLKSTQ